ncbi:DNA recombination protein RmuC [Corynebacterium sp. CCUG 71335]|uniref:DNA recombination protein RmuC n=1 Tax=unclassified Corynebacterium TaxID=2624378 RepID=UPI002109F582|nr:MULTISPECIES: DNA recombination protein RmuC [unclassified Corynebacterium]MCQ4619727.1 DNA recombination protein RmuC [Corynebacterium sp. CCUG 71335]MCQ4623521.1 DNA recombination protein RmuC [Corynebacterium sp. CCUG 70398]MCQ4625668.1 DNA recombination protein RmuC [Corynebacterium sp. CCUG 69979]
MSSVSPALTFTLVFLAFILGLLAGAAAMHLLRRPASPPSQPPRQDVRRELEPLERAVDKLAAQLRDMDEDRAVAHSALAGQVQAVTRASSRLSDRTDQLVNALRSPNTRGRWGEMQLERVVELGGMVKYCDFDVQQAARIDGQLLRPDMIIRLSRGRNIVVDAKVPFSAYLDALNTEDPEEKAGYLRRHSHLLRQHVATLGQKAYVEAFAPTPEFVVMFIPADPFLDAALEQDPQLLDDAFARGVVIATPSTLFALLRTVGLGWQQEDINAKAAEVQRLGAQLYTRLGTMAEHYNRVGGSLDKAVEAFNATLGSMDARVMVTARRLKDLDLPGRTTSEPTELRAVTARARTANGEESSHSHVE